MTEWRNGFWWGWSAATVGYLVGQVIVVLVL